MVQGISTTNRIPCAVQGRARRIQILNSFCDEILFLELWHERKQDPETPSLMMYVIYSYLWVFWTLLQIVQRTISAVLLRQKEYLKRSHERWTHLRGMLYWSTTYALSGTHSVYTCILQFFKEFVYFNQADLLHFCCLHLTPNVCKVTVTFREERVQFKDSPSRRG